MADIKIGRMVLGILHTNCYFLYREGTADAIVVDPADGGAYIVNMLEQNGFRVAGILLTHGHFDHTLGCEELRAIANEVAAKNGEEPVKVYACEPEKEILNNAHLNLSTEFYDPYTTDADVYVKDGEEITIAGMTCKVLATPGHTVGGCCYYFEEVGFLLSGDTLMQESVGRTDFYSGSMRALVRSIKEKLFILPDETIVYPGHGGSTTIGDEKKYNPFCV